MYYYDDCTPAAALEVIKEITEYARNASAACELIRAFMNNEMSTTEIEDFLF